MAFSHVRKAFRPIRRDLSKHTTEFIQQVQVQVQCAKTSVARKLLSLSMGISEEIEDAKITAEKTKISKLKGRSENYPKFA